MQFDAAEGRQPAPASTSGPGAVATVSWPPWQAIVAVPWLTAPVLLVPIGWGPRAQCQPQLQPAPVPQGYAAGYAAVGMPPESRCCADASPAQVPFAAGLSSPSECGLDGPYPRHGGGEEGRCSGSPGRGQCAGDRGRAEGDGAADRGRPSARSSCSSVSGFSGGRRRSRGRSEPDVWSEPIEPPRDSGGVCSPRRCGRRSWRRGRGDRPSKARFYARCRAFRDAAFADEDADETPIAADAIVAAVAACAPSSASASTTTAAERRRRGLGGERAEAGADECEAEGEEEAVAEEVKAATEAGETVQAAAAVQAAGASLEASRVEAWQAGAPFEGALACQGEPGEASVTIGLPLTAVPPTCIVVDIFTPESSPRMTRSLSAGAVPRTRALRVPRSVRALEPCSLNAFPVDPLGHPPPLHGEAVTVVSGSGSSLSEDPPPGHGLADAVEAVETSSPPVAGLAALAGCGPPPCHGMASPCLPNSVAPPPVVIGLADTATDDVGAGSPSPAAGLADSGARERWADDDSAEEVAPCSATAINWPGYVEILGRTSFLDVADEVHADLEYLAAEVRHRLLETGDALEVRELVSILVAAAPARAALADDRCAALQEELLTFTLARARGQRLPILF